MYYEICGGKKLFGEVDVYGAKNTILPLLASALLTDSQSKISNCRPLGDVETMCQILRELGAEVIWNGDTISVFTEGQNRIAVSSFLASKISDLKFSVVNLLDISRGAFSLLIALFNNAKKTFSIAFL